jgi:hypothetical protein
VHGAIAQIETETKVKVVVFQSAVRILSRSAQ